MRRLILWFKHKIGYDPEVDDKLTPTLLERDPAKHFETWDRDMHRWGGG